MKLLFITFILSQFLSTGQQVDTISLRPKPKARAGGANKKVAPIFSFAFVSYVTIGSDFYTLSVGVLLDGIWVMNPQCTDCKPSTTQYNFSSVYSMPLYVNKSYEHETFNMDIEGSVYLDAVSLYDYNPIDYPVIVCSKFFDVYNMAIDGILGLGSGKDSIVYKMFEVGIIDKPTYSVSALTTPFVTLGTPNFLPLHLVIQSQLNISIAKPLQVTEFQFGNWTLKEITPAEINSFSSYITGPFKYLASVFQILVKIGCHFEEELLMCQCGSTQYPNFIFKIQNKIFNISSSDYLIKLGDNCFVGFKSGKNWILGEPFLKAYFLEFDLDKQLMVAYKVTTLGDALPSPFQTTEGWKIMILLAISLGVLYLIAFLLFLGYESLMIRYVINKDLENMNKKKRIL